MAGRASVELHTLIFFRGKEVVADARITKVRSLQAARAKMDAKGCCTNSRCL